MCHLAFGSADGLYIESAPGGEDTPTCHSGLGALLQPDLSSDTVKSVHRDSAVMTLERMLLQAPFH